MCISKNEQANKSKMLNRNRIPNDVRGVLTSARFERRLVCGLLPAITYLEKNPENAVLCVVPETRPGDAAAHIQTVLLQAFCFENYIPVIQVNSSERLADICGVSATSRGRSVECLCAVVTKDSNSIVNIEDPHLSPSEEALTQFYECTLDEYPRPVINLPPITAT